MQNSQNKRIEDYLNQKMPPKEKKSFELDLKNNPELQLELRRSMMVENIIEVLGQKN